MEFTAVENASPLSFYSSSFDPILVLNTPSIVPPRTNAPSFPDFSKAEFLVPFPFQRIKFQLPPSANDDIYRQLKNHELRHYYRLKREKQRHRQELDLLKKLSQITQPLTPTFIPLSKWIETQTPVEVCIRQCHLGKMKRWVGVPLCYTLNWDVFLRTSDAVVFLRGDDMVYVRSAQSR